uniref:GPN-loop GTPase 2 n=1 Tax=Parastrongyloides trichosuri TaxID=131310 RepID=A0A0N4ZWV0_PARTI
MVLYGQLVIGAPGAGKSTYCNALTEIFTALKRPYKVINLDPANDILPFDADVDINELITVQQVMKEKNLGPNGALVYCIKYLLANIEWLKEKLQNFDHYLIIDMPGQLELYATHDDVKNIIKELERFGIRLCSVHLSDSLYATDPSKFISVLCSALAIMVNLEMPQVNVLSKVDLLKNDDELSYSWDFFERLPDLKYLTDLLDDIGPLKKYGELNKKLCEVVQDYDLVCFQSLSVTSKEKMLQLIKQVDKANGFALLDVDDIRNYTFTCE